MEAARRATEDDVDRLAVLFREAIDELRPTRGGEVFAEREARGEPVEDSFRADLATEDAAVWVGTIDDSAIGYAAARIEPLRDNRRLGVITDLYVEDGAREVGVGEALMAAVIEWLESNQCDAADATALPGNRATKNFFEGSGFSARLIVMHRRLR